MLPADYPRKPPSGPPSHVVAVADRLNVQRIAHGSTEFAVLLAAYAVLLARQCQQKELVIGIPVSQRQRGADLEMAYVNLEKLASIQHSNYCIPLL